MKVNGSLLPGASLTWCSSPRLQLKNLGSGTFGVARLMRHVRTGELVAVKFLPRGDSVCAPLPRRCTSIHPLEHTILSFSQFLGVLRAQKDDNKVGSER